jgi:kynurenine 3-monooxygenase
MLLLGDAAHAITPFHGQGMNCALEDCVTLDRLFDTAGSWSGALADFDRTRRSDTDAIATMAIENYQEMRDTVRAPQFQLQKALSLELERRFPDRFVPRYSMVMFHDDIPYSVALSRGRIQAEILDSLTATATTLADIDYDRAAASITQQLPALPGK